jgi:hypothetical protein
MGFAITGLHNRLVNIVDGKAEDFKDQLGYEDEDDEGHLPLENIENNWRLEGLP